jgi:hypothetical protein
MDDQVIALRQQIADEVRATLRAPGYGHPAHVEMASGTGPCRLCLRPFRRNEEERVLFTHNADCVIAQRWLHLQPALRRRSSR